MASSIIVSVEGNIGSGKSTFLEDLKRSQCKNIGNYRFVFVQEPVGEWMQIKDKSGKNMLTKFYDNQKRYAFSFQMMAYISRLVLLKRTYEENPTNTIIVTERSMHTDRHVFAKMLYDDNKIEDVEYQIYLKWFDEFIKELPLSGMVYLRTIPETSYVRVIKRDREGETIDLSYLKKCFTYHESWLNVESKVFVLDITEENNETNTAYWINEFTKYLRRSLLNEVDQIETCASVDGI
jgi:deoxyadenosine/deoxycytidine kinase